MLDKHVGQAIKQMYRQEEAHIGDTLAVKFGFKMRVTTRKPKWMPQWFYYQLMRSVLVETSQPIFSEVK